MRLAERFRNFLSDWGGFWCTCRFCEDGLCRKKGLGSIFFLSYRHSKQSLKEVSKRYQDDFLQKEVALVRWFVRYYLFIVRSNILINMAVSTSLGSLLARAHTVYQDLNPDSSPHRLKFESDPATPRPDIAPLPYKPCPNGPSGKDCWTKQGFPDCVLCT